MEMKKSEIVDRWSILQMKIRYTNSVSAELDEYDREVKKIVSSTAFDYRLFSAIRAIIEANAKVWMLEASIRSEFKNDPSAQGRKLTMEEIGERAIQIRDFNKMRVTAKTIIDKIFSEPVDVKVAHASQSSPRLSLYPPNEMINKMLKGVDYSG